MPDEMYRDEAYRVRLEVNLGGLRMKNPVTVASGTFASGREYAELWETTLHARQELSAGSAVNTGQGLRTEQTLRAGSAINTGQGLLDPPGLFALGAVTTKGVSYEPWPGNATPRITETASGMLNAIGLQNKGVEAFCADDLAWLAARACGLPVIVNVCGHTVDEFAPVINRLEREPNVSAYELNISCPNLDCGGMALGVVPETAAAVTSSCRALTSRPVIVKLTPNVIDITEVARAVEAAGADAISLINTLAGMAINPYTRKPILARGAGGLSGPAIKPVALLAVHRCYKAVRIPLLGMGGIQNASDAIEFILAGATAVAVGTANFSAPLTALYLARDIEGWCLEQGVSDIRELIGGLDA